MPKVILTKKLSQKSWSTGTILRHYADFKFCNVPFASNYLKRDWHLAFGQKKYDTGVLRTELSSSTLYIFRYYSIASCNQYLLMDGGGVKTPQTTHIDLLLNVVNSKTPGGFDKKGLCSNYLNETPMGSLVAIYHREAPSFHLPDLTSEEDVPMVLVGSGSGLAPFRGFWEQVCLESQCILDTEGQRRSDSAFMTSRVRKNKLQLFYGCHNEKADLLLDETRPLALDVLSRYSAYSRDVKRPKKYVQDLVVEQGATVYDVLINR